MFFIGGNVFAIYDTNVVLGDDYCSINNLFDTFEIITIFIWWVNDGILFLWSDIEGVFRGKSVIYYRCGGNMLNESVGNRVLNIILFYAILIYWRF